MRAWRRVGGCAHGGGRGPARVDRADYGLGRLPQQGLVAVAVSHVGRSHRARLLYVTCIRSASPHRAPSSRDLVARMYSNRK